MFTGIIEETSTVVANADAVLRIGSPASFSGMQAGTSLCVNGVCMTVSSVGDRWLGFDLSAETARRTTLARLAPGAPVNLERPLHIGDLLGGHIVLGHVDATGTITAVEPQLRVRIPKTLMAYCVEKGSIALDGVSLTIFDLDEDSFSVAIIPFTAEHTNLGHLGVGDSVNVEVDVVAKQIERLVAAYLSRLDA